MNYNKKTVYDIDVAGKKVLLRCDFNVPQDKETHAITRAKRIVASLPTIRYLLERGAAVIACSHLGKPKGQWKDSLPLRPVAEHLSQLLGQEVIFAQVVFSKKVRSISMFNVLPKRLGRVNRDTLGRSSRNSLIIKVLST